MAKLNQIIAVEKGAKSQNTAVLSEIYKAAQKAPLFDGFSKTYQPLDDDGEVFPPESKHVQYRVGDVIKQATNSLTDLFTVTARKDWTNTQAKADIKIGGKVLLSGVPVSYLLFLEKNILDLRTFVNSLPTLDQAEIWTQGDGLWRTAPIQTHKSKKIQKPVVLYEATPQHPAQVQLAGEDVTIGHWRNVKLSGAIPVTEKQAFVARVEKLLRAIKEAREEANAIEEVTVPKVAEALFSYVFDGA
jgi:hypothetical protein